MIIFNKQKRIENLAREIEDLETKEGFLKDIVRDGIFGRCATDQGIKEMAIASKPELYQTRKQLTSKRDRLYQLSQKVNGYAVIRS
ncbi:MAG: hypothetical protein ABIH63_04880 [archaeon]